MAITAEPNDNITSLPSAQSRAVKVRVCVSPFSTGPKFKPRGGVTCDRGDAF